MASIRGILGVVVLIGVAWVFSTDRRRFPFKTVAGGLILQALLALVVLRTEAGRSFFTALASVVNVFFECTEVGARFLFGNLVEVREAHWGVIFACKVLPSIIVFSALSALGYHWGILQVVVRALARVMTKLMGVTGAESLSAAANVFLGQTEAPLLVRPYIATMTRSELMALMVGGFATISAGVMASYVAILGGDDPVRRVEVARHFLTASLMAAPASFVMSKILLPESENPQTFGDACLLVERPSLNAVHALALGAAEGLTLALNVGAMLITFIAVIALLDHGLAWFGQLAMIAPLRTFCGLEQLSLGGILGLLFCPVAFLIGAEPGQFRVLGSLLGTAMSANEFVAYFVLGDLVRQGVASPRTLVLATYALCGFANFSSIAIQIAGLGGMAPQRRGDLARLGLRAMFGGAMACWMTACIAGMLT